MVSWERAVINRVPERSRRAVLLAVLLFGSVFSYYLISTFLLGLVEVSGGSMAPTLMAGDTYVLHKWRLHLHPPRRGHIVAIRDPLDDGLSVKRVIGLPREEVSIRNGAVHVNGTPMPEDWLSSKVKTYPYAGFPTTFALGEDEYLVLGDNRRASLDGRVYGGIPRGRIVGLLHR